MSGTPRSSRRVYGWRGAREELVARADLDDPPGVHDRDAVGELGDDREVVADVQRRDLVARGTDRARSRARAPASSRRGRSSARRRTITRGPVRRTPSRSRRAAAGRPRAGAGSGGGSVVVGRQRDLLERLAQPRRARSLATRRRVRLEHLLELGADPQRRVERRGRDPAGCRTTVPPRRRAQVPLGRSSARSRPSIEDRAAARSAPPRRAWPSSAMPDGRLAASRTRRRARAPRRRRSRTRSRRRRRRSCRSARCAGRRPRRRARVLGGAHSSSPPGRCRSRRARCRPSTRFVPIGEQADREHREDDRPRLDGRSPSRFSLIIRPQSAAGGCRPKPRKLSAGDERRSSTSGAARTRRAAGSSRSAAARRRGSATRCSPTRLGRLDEVALDDLRAPRRA